MIDPKIVAAMKKRPDWAAIERHLFDAVNSLDTITGIKGTDDRAIALETLARQRAIEKLKEILEPFTNFKERGSMENAVTDKRREAGLE